MKMLIVAEGRHELHGALEALIHRILGSAIECSFTQIRRDEDRLLGKLPRLHGKGGGFFKRAVRWMMLADQREFDAIVLLIDEDGDASRLQQMADAQMYMRVSIRRAMGVAVRTFDAWMFADEVALSKVLERTFQREANPEGNKNPKSFFTKLPEATSGQRKLYAQIADNVDIQTLEDRCPLGFAPFANRVRKLKVTS